MTAIAQRILDTPIAPYLSLLESMSREDKQVLVTFLVDSLPGIKIIDTNTDGDTEMSSEDEAFLQEKLNNMTFSPRIERLFEKRKEAAKKIDIEDERTRHILGI